MFNRIYRSKLVVLVLIAAIGLVACAPAATPAPVPPAPVVGQPTSAPAAAPTASAPVSKAVTLQIAQNNTLGQIISDGDGRTLYLLTKDGKNTSNCYDKCEQSWPPVLPAGQPTLKDPISTALISTTVRKDGSVQLTYNGWPLYYYAKDSAPGDTNGQSIGKVWWVVSGEGNPIKPATVVLTPSATLGNILADDTGRTVYLFTKDTTKNTSSCYDKCEQSWPPLLSLGQPTLGDAVSSGLISTTLRKDGTTQVTYNGWPLYYFGGDSATGDTKGQGLGKVWWVVAGEGNPIRPATLAVTQTDKLGKIIVDGAGRTLYVLTKDTANTTTCYDKCEQAWPPLLMLDKPTVGDGVDASLLGSAQRKDGTMQVTLNGMPLYYFAADQAPGDTNGQGIGGVWFVVGPDGKIIGK